MLIDVAENNEINDYMQEGDVGFKKPKVCTGPNFRSGYILTCLQDEEEAAIATSA
jgi:hypothetical protein